MADHPWTTAAALSVYATLEAAASLKPVLQALKRAETHRGRRAACRQLLDLCKRDAVLRAVVAGGPVARAASLDALESIVAHAGALRDRFEDNSDRVRIVVSHDELSTFDDCYGDTFKAAANPEVERSVLAEQEMQARREFVHDEGARQIIAQVRRCDQWQVLDSCGGLVPSEWASSELNPHRNEMIERLLVELAALEDSEGSDACEDACALDWQKQRSDEWVAARDAQRLRWYLVIIDESSLWTLPDEVPDVYTSETRPSGVESVYLCTPDMVTHIASLTPSVELHRIRTRLRWTDVHDDAEVTERIEEWFLDHCTSLADVDYTDARPFWRKWPVDEVLDFYVDGCKRMMFVGVTDRPSAVSGEESYEAQLESLHEHVTCNELI